MISADRQTEEAGLYLQAESNNSQHPRQEFPPPPEREGEGEGGGGGGVEGGCRRRVFM